MLGYCGKNIKAKITAKLKCSWILLHNDTPIKLQIKNLGHFPEHIPPTANNIFLKDAMCASNTILEVKLPGNVNNVKYYFICVNVVKNIMHFKHSILMNSILQVYY